MLKNIFMSLVFIGLTGCGLMTYNIDPKFPQARLSFYENKLFSNQNALIIFNDYKACTGHRGTLTALHKSIAIYANMPVTILIHHVWGYDNSLLFPITFIPKPDHVYLARITQKNLGKKTEFTFTLLDNNQVTSFIERDFKASAFSASCVDANNISDKKVTSIKKSAWSEQIIIVPASY